MQTDNEKYNETVQPNTAFLNELKDKLPEFFTKDGSFDLDKFKNQLKDKNVNELSEGYQLDFIGKDYARRQAGEMPTTVIVPDEKQNRGGGAHSKNLFFTGDNLEVLRHLQNNYQNKIDVIYIDPPYNTGSDGFVYPDSFEYSDDQLKDMFGLDDDQVERLKSIQGKSSHSAWLTFMYPRLAVAKKLLSEKGIIFVSIDDNEFDDLTLIFKELFGETNLLENYVWEDTFRPDNSSPINRKNAEYIIAYGKNKNNINRLIGTVKTSTGLPSLTKNTMPVETLSFGPSVVKTYLADGIYKAGKKESKYELLDNIKVKSGIIVNAFRLKGRMIWGQKYLNDQIQKGTEIIIKNESMVPYSKKAETSAAPNKLIPSRKEFDNGVSDVLAGRSEVANLFNGSPVFSYPKPSNLICYLLKMIPNSNNYSILDFFAGSSTTADAVMQLNAEDGGHRKFIMVQLPEKTYEVNKETGLPKLDNNGNKIPTKGGKTAYEAGYMSVDQISRERIRRAAKKIRENNELTLPKDFDGSFKHYRVVKPVKQTLEEIDDFDPNNTNLFTDMVDGFSSKSLGIEGDATGEETILTTWLAKDGYPFDADVEEVKFDNYTAHKVENNRLYLINEGWGAAQTKELLNQLGTHQLEVQSVVIFGYSFNVAELRELENGLKQLDSKVTLIKRY